METFQITTFKANKKDGFKMPLSPTYDNEFQFKTQTVQTLKDVWCVMNENDILNLPLDKDAKCRRKTETLSTLIEKNKKFNYLVLDIDDVKTPQERDKILDFFRPYNCVISASKSYFTHKDADRIEFETQELARKAKKGTKSWHLWKDYASKNPMKPIKYNLKGVLQTQGLTLEETREVLRVIKNKIQGKLDLQAGSFVTYNYPMFTDKILLENLDKEIFGEIQELKEIKENKTRARQHLEVPREFKTAFSAEVLDEFKTQAIKYWETKGFWFYSESDNRENLTFFSNEENTKGGWYTTIFAPKELRHFSGDKTRTKQGNSRGLRELHTKVKSLRVYETLKEVIKPEYAESVKLEARYLSDDPKFKEKVQDFLKSETTKVLKIQSPMGSGKTREIILKAKEEGKCFLYISHRQALARQLSDTYDVPNYQDGTYEKQKSLCVQYDSLKNYDIKDFDFIILDEAMSLVQYAINPASASPEWSNLALQQFSYIFTPQFLENRKLVIMDAFLFQFENYIFPTLNTLKTVVIQNTFRDSVINLTNDISLFLNKVTQVLVQKQDDEMVTISVTSKGIIPKLEDMCKKQKLTLKVLSSETEQQEFNDIVQKLQNPETPKMWDVLVYTPKITVGIDINANIKTHFHYDTGRSVDPVVSAQMIKRARRATEFYVFLNKRTNCFKTDVQEITEEHKQETLGWVHLEGQILFHKDLGETKSKIEVLKNSLSLNFFVTAKTLLKLQFKVIKEMTFSDDYVAETNIGKIKNPKDCEGGLALLEHVMFKTECSALGIKRLIFRKHNFDQFSIEKQVSIHDLRVLETLKPEDIKTEYTKAEILENFRIKKLVELLKFRKNKETQKWELKSRLNPELIQIHKNLLHI